MTSCRSTTTRRHVHLQPGSLSVSSHLASCGTRTRCFPELELLADCCRHSLTPDTQLKMWVERGKEAEAKANSALAPPPVMPRPAGSQDAQLRCAPGRRHRWQLTQASGSLDSLPFAQLWLEAGQLVLWLPVLPLRVHLRATARWRRQQRRRGGRQLRWWCCAIAAAAATPVSPRWH